MDKVLFVALGGAIGSSFRYLIYLGLTNLLSKVFIWGTFTANMLGALLIGILWAYFDNNLSNPNLKVFLIIGILGGFTTFSSYAIETVNLFKTNGIHIVILYILATNILGILAAWLGFYISKQIF